MNLHIAPDNTFVNTFYDNLREASLLENNRIVIRTNNQQLKAVKHDVGHAALYTSKFDSFVGDTYSYEKVFIHYFTPLLYRWVASRKFKEVNWMTWGGDVYNLPGLDRYCYEPLTIERYVKKNRSWQHFLYSLKVFVLHSAFEKKAYSKIANILTWMEEEYQFASRHLPVKANHKFFFYENQFPYSELDAITTQPKDRRRPLLIIGNSGSPTNNHLDAVEFLEKHRVEADLLIPVSYGDKHYISFLKRTLRYGHGSVEFVDRYMEFHEYLQFLANSDGLVMNTIRPQGYGNILMMLYLGKPVFFNAKNVSLPDLTRYGIKWRPMEDVVNVSANSSLDSNKEAIVSLLSHKRLIEQYRQLFA